ncbi:MAG: polysaccharide biosynthesis C-terminal domain-containing protein [bacterium]
MFKKIIGTIGTRLVSAVLTLIIWILVARYMGAANLGTISLIILAVTIVQLFTNFFGGSAIVYMTPRTGIYKLLIPAYIWSFILTLGATYLLHIMRLISHRLEVIPSGYFSEVLFLGLIMSLFSANSMFLLGKEKIRLFNILSLLQVCLLFILLAYFLFFREEAGVMSYYWSIMISFLVVLVVSFIALLPLVKKVPLSGMKEICREVLRFGTYVQFANIFQQLNYRLSYYIVDFFLGRVTLGVFTVGVQLSEGLWLIPRSIGMVQLTRLSNEMDQGYAVRLSLTLLKISWIITLLILIFLLMIPAYFFQLVFGSEFSEIKVVIATLGIGIVTLSISIILSQFFSGVNKPYHNTISSAIGLIVTIGAGFLLIPRYGIIGAGITSTISYTVATIYQFIVFSGIAKLSFSDLFIKRSEISLLVFELKKILHGKEEGASTLP